jgi:hypothetical protein
MVVSRAMTRRPSALEEAKAATSMRKNLTWGLGSTAALFTLSGSTVTVLEPAKKQRKDKIMIKKSK